MLASRAIGCNERRCAAEEARLPGPGLELIGEEEIAEVVETFNLDPVDVEARITPRTRAIMAVHMLGNPARLTELRAVADRHGVALIEDCAQAFGARYRGGGVGRIGEAGMFSFNEFKPNTCGAGGRTVTHAEGLYRRCFA